VLLGMIRDQRLLLAQQGGQSEGMRLQVVVEMRDTTITATVARGKVRAKVKAVGRVHMQQQWSGTTETGCYSMGTTDMLPLSGPLPPQRRQRVGDSTTRTTHKASRSHDTVAKAVGPTMQAPMQARIGERWRTLADNHLVLVQQQVAIATTTVMVVAEAVIEGAHNMVARRPAQCVAAMLHHHRCEHRRRPWQVWEEGTITSLADTPADPTSMVHTGLKVEDRVATGAGATAGHVHSDSEVDRASCRPSAC
jgi:hypothetical protein